MARKSFATRTEKNVIEVDGIEYEFPGEVIGAEFADAYAALAEVQTTLGDGTAVDPTALKAVDAALAEFLSKMMLPESREEFAKVTLPTRILTGMLEFVIEVYSGNDENPSS